MKAPHVHTTLEGRLACRECPTPPYCGHTSLAKGITLDCDKCRESALRIARAWAASLETSLERQMTCAS